MLDKIGNMQDKPTLTTVTFSWRLPDNRRTQAQFGVETIDYEAAKDRIICVLRELLSPLDPALSDEVRGQIQGLIGRWVMIPSEARLGLTLPLKYETLTGRIRYFHQQDPRKRIEN